MKNQKLYPESLMMSYGYHPEWSEGAIKPPIFQTSTFVFDSAEEGKAFFASAYGINEASKSGQTGLIYSRINNPNLEILENRLCLWDEAEDCAVFESGMSAISTTLLEYLSPGDLLLFSMPVYGGTDHFIHHFLKKMGIEIIGFGPDDTYENIKQKVKKSGLQDKLKMVYIETPANPTNDLIDISLCKKIAQEFSTPENEVVVAVDNTYMGPIWSQPLNLGADLVIYSATKYIGGHSDLIAGAVLGSVSAIKRIKTLRTFLGNMPSPHTCWLLSRSLETLKVRMDQQCKNAMVIADFLNGHPMIEQVNYLGLLNTESKYFNIYKKQYSAPGAMISFYIKGGESEAFQFLNQLRIFKLAVSLGSTESLAQHPATMTHAGVDPQDKIEMRINDQLIRLSIGIENADDLIWDIQQSLEKLEEDIKVVHPENQSL